MDNAPKEGFHPLCILWANEAIIKQEGSIHTILLKDVDHKVLFIAARPKFVREFINVEKFMNTWIKHTTAFVKNPPEIAITYTTMIKNIDGIAYAIPIQLYNPINKKTSSWKFTLSFSEEVIHEGTYRDIALFIDWLPSSICPEPVTLLFPELTI